MKNEKDVFDRSSEFWGICCEGGKKYSQVVRKRFHITMAALDPTVVPTSPVVSLMVDRGGCEYLLCSLKPSSLLQVNLNLYFDKGEKVIFSLKGSGKIHLSGYHILDENRPIQKEAIEKTVTFKQNNKSNLKQNVKTSEDDTFDDLEESSSDEESNEENEDSKKLKTYKRLWSSLAQSDEEESGSSEEESDDEEEEEDEKEEVKEISKKKNKDFQDRKKLKMQTSTTPVLNKKPMQNTPAKKLADKTSPLKKTPDSNDMNSSIGRTPMPQKKTPKVNQANLSPKKVNFADDSDESSDSDNEVKNQSNILSPTKSDESSSNKEIKKKKKKKKKQAKDALNISNSTEETVGKKGETSLSAASYSQKLSGGLEYEDLRVGNGPVAKRGKLVHVYYTGMLANNKVFDSCKPGAKPFSFKLGAEQVIKGWDLGIEGMKVGGKRRLKIPPNLGYKNERMGPIPPMSTLHFTVELKAVS